MTQTNMTTIPALWVIAVWTLTYPPDEYIIPPVWTQLTQDQQTTANHYRVENVPIILLDLLVNDLGRNCYEWPVPSQTVACDHPICEAAVYDDPNYILTSYHPCNFPMGENGCELDFQPVTAAGVAVGDPIHISKPSHTESLFEYEVDDRCNVTGCCPLWLPTHLPPITRYMRVDEPCSVSPWEADPIPKCPMSDAVFGGSIVDEPSLYDPNAAPTAPDCTTWPWGQ